MGYIPLNAKWYLAEIVEKLQVEDEHQAIVHINIVLVRADSPEEAYRNSIDLGREGEQSYTNAKGKQLNITFQGLRDLFVIVDDLEHGAELIYEQKQGLTELEIQGLVKDKEHLSIFCPRNTTINLDLMPQDVMDMLQDIEDIDSEVDSQD